MTRNLTNGEWKKRIQGVWNNLLHAAFVRWLLAIFSGSHGCGDAASRADNGLSRNRWSSIHPVSLARLGQRCGKATSWGAWWPLLPDRFSGRSSSGNPRVCVCARLGGGGVTMSWPQG